MITSSKGSRLQKYLDDPTEGSGSVSILSLYKSLKAALIIIFFRPPRVSYRGQMNFNIKSLLL